MAEGSIHSDGSHGTDDLRISCSSSMFDNIISYQDDLELHDIVQPCQF